MEMAHLLPNQMAPPPLYPEQFRQHEVMEEPYTVRSIAPSQIQKDKLIGEGQFGILHKGYWAGIQVNGEPMTVRFRLFD